VPAVVTAVAGSCNVVNADLTSRRGETWPPGTNKQMPRLNSLGLRVGWENLRTNRFGRKSSRSQEQPRKLVRGQFNDKHQHRYNKILKQKCERNTD